MEANLEMCLESKIFTSESNLVRFEGSFPLGYICTLLGHSTVWECYLRMHLSIIAIYLTCSFLFFIVLEAPPNHELKPERDLPLDRN